MNDMYKQCLNCGKALNRIEGKREKVFCNTTCRSNYWQKSERLEKKGLTVEQIVATIRKGWVSKASKKNAGNNNPGNKIETENNSKLESIEPDMPEWKKRLIEFRNKQNKQK